jgi:hypothetical protein
MSLARALLQQRQRVERCTRQCPNGEVEGLGDDAVRHKRTKIWGIHPQTPQKTRSTGPGDEHALQQNKRLAPGAVVIPHFPGLSAFPIPCPWRRATVGAADRDKVLCNCRLNRVSLLSLLKLLLSSAAAPYVWSFYTSFRR